MQLLSAVVRQNREGSTDRQSHAGGAAGQRADGDGPTGEVDKDFVPSGTAVTETRNIVQTATCQKCHGPEFAGHGGDRVTVTNLKVLAVDAKAGEIIVSGAVPCAWLAVTTIRTGPAAV